MGQQDWYANATSYYGGRRAADALSVNSLCERTCLRHDLHPSQCTFIDYCSVQAGVQARGCNVDAIAANFLPGENLRLVFRLAVKARKVTFAATNAFGELKYGLKYTFCSVL